jgi:capsular polysaccharide biosynthesis protein
VGSLDLVRAFRRGWWIIVLTVLVALVVGFFITRAQERVYVSTATLVVIPSAAAADPGEIVRSIETLERRTLVATLAKIPATGEMMRVLAGRVNIAAPGISDYHVHGSVVASTNLVRIDVEGPDAETAAVLANTAAQLTAAEAQRLYRVYAMQILSEAVAAPQPRYPEPRRNASIAIMLGLVAGVAAALALDHFTVHPARPLAR